MILECPSCHNRYLVDPRAVGANGRTVRCAKCKNQWFAAPPEEEPAEDVIQVEEEAPREAPPIPEGSSVPAIAPASSVPFALKVATIALGVLCLLVSLVYFRPAIVGAIPATAGAYAALGMYDSSGVVFAGLEYEKATPEGEMLKDEHVFKGYLVNTAPEPRHVPQIVITLRGKDDVLLRQHKLSGDVTLAPGETLGFDRRLSTSPESLRRVIIEQGSPFELFLR